MLQPLREPAALSWWPPAPGWWVLAALLLALIVALLRMLLKKYRAGAALREARKTIKQLREQDLAPQALSRELSQLQRQLGIALRGRSACAGLSGEDWRGFLNSLGRNGEEYFEPQLMDLPYRPSVDPADSEELLAATERWVRDLRAAA